jgi:hypothetical protein
VTRVIRIRLNEIQVTLKNRVRPEKLIVCHLDKKLYHFTESEISLPLSKDSAVGSCPDLEVNMQNLSFLFLWDKF